MKKIAVLNDLSGLGKCSLTAAIPVISVMGIQACPLPTAVLSCQTGFPSYFCDDYTDRMDKFMDEWKNLDFHPDGIYTGFLADAAQADKVVSFIEQFGGENVKILVDPVMGDDGEEYPIYTEALCEKMRFLVKRAAVITPNLTEALLLLHGRECAHKIWSKISNLAEKELKEFVEETGNKLAMEYETEVVITGIDFPVKAGDKIAGTRIIPLVIEEEKMQKACEVAGKEPIFRILPYQKKKAGIVTTGSEVYYHRIEDKFTPVVIEKLKECGVTEVKQIQCNDDHEMITEAIQTLIEDGSDLIVCTGGMSVDPDDRTPLAIKNACTEVVTYGAPVLPGAMFMLAYCEKEGRQIPVMGLPGCVMYAKRTIFDLVLPRIMCDEKLHEKDFRLLGQGGLCLSCPVCTFPNCGFGKGKY